MLFHPELARYAQHPRTWPSVRALLGGDACQWVQLDFRESPAGAARPGALSSSATLAKRDWRVFTTHGAASSDVGPLTHCLLREKSGNITYGAPSAPCPAAAAAMRCCTTAARRRVASKRRRDVCSCSSKKVASARFRAVRK